MNVQIWRSKTTRIMIATVPPEWDLRNIRPIEFCLMECTCYRTSVTQFPSSRIASFRIWSLV